MSDNLTITFLAIALGAALADHMYDLAFPIGLFLVSYLYYAWKGKKEHKKASDYFWG